MQIFEATLRWLSHAPEERSEFVHNVFTHIRFALIDDHYFYDNVKNNVHLQVRACARARACVCVCVRVCVRVCMCVCCGGGVG